MRDGLQVESFLAPERGIKAWRPNAHGVAKIVHRCRGEPFAPKDAHGRVQRRVTAESPWSTQRWHVKFLFCVDQHRRALVMTLSGKRALVTGASRGIGAAIAKALAAEGVNVAITYEKSADSAAEVVGAIKAKGRRAVAIQADSADAV